MSIDHTINEIYNSNIREVILIGDSTILLNYGHQFMGSLHIVDSRSQTQGTSHCYLYKVLKYN